MLASLLMILLLLTALFLIVLVLIQRGKGGGLAGALGGMGGQSAFGTKAGDLFTKITIGVATFWIILCVVTVKVLGTGEGKLSKTLGGAAEPSSAVVAPASTDKQPADSQGAAPAGQTPTSPESTPGKDQTKP